MRIRGRASEPAAEILTPGKSPAATSRMGKDLSVRFFREMLVPKKGLELEAFCGRPSPQPKS